MENFENWNKKVRKKNLNGNSNSNENTNSTQRDYDKEPIIIKNYEQFFVSNLFFYSLFLAVIIGMPFFNLVFNTPIPNFDFNDKGFLIIFCFFMLLLLQLIISFYIHTIKHKHEIYFTNSSVDFYKDGVLQRKCLHKDIRDNICKRFWVYNFIGSSEEFMTICFYILLLTIGGWTLFIPLYISNLIFKFCTHIIVGGKIQDFKVFPFIIIADPQYDRNTAPQTMIISGKYFLIYTKNKQDYSDIKEYFLQTSNINIDFIKKHYF